MISDANPILKNGIMKIVRGVLVVMRAEKIAANLYMLKGETLEEADVCVASSNHGEESTMMWHRKLGHISERGLKILSDRNLLPGLKSLNLPFCDHCVTSKHHRLKFSKSVARIKCINDYSTRCWVYPIKRKSDGFPVFKALKARLELE